MVAESGVTFITRSAVDNSNIAGGGRTWNPLLSSRHLFRRYDADRSAGRSSEVSECSHPPPSLPSTAPAVAPADDFAIDAGARSERRLLGLARAGGGGRGRGGGLRTPTSSISAAADEDAANSVRPDTPHPEFSDDDLDGIFFPPEDSDDGEEEEGAEAREGGAGRGRGVDPSTKSSFVNFIAKAGDGFAPPAACPASACGGKPSDEEAGESPEE